MSTATKTQRQSSGFPEDEITSSLEEWWDSEVSAREADPFAPPRGTLYDVVVAIDSLSSVNALIMIERHVDFEIPAQVIKRGGFRNREEMIAHIVPKVRDLYFKHHPHVAALTA